MKKSVVVAAIIVLLAGIAPAEEPPSWLPLPGQPGTSIATDILEIPGQGTLLVCGMGGNNGSVVFRSTDRGSSWSQTLYRPWAWAFTQLARDSVTERVWVTGNGRGYGPQLYYSDDDGASWTPETLPQSYPTYDPRSMEIVGDYLYLGGETSSPYSICLYRLQQDSLSWEMVTDYIECDAITRLKYDNGKLLVFARDKNHSQTRVFTYTPE
jgi:hypothetical protein